LIIALMLAPKCFPRPSKQPVPQERIHIGVLFYNEAGVSAEQVSAAEEVVSEVLQPAGIELTWNDCTVIRSASGSVSSPCDTSGTPHLPTDFVLYFVGPLEEHFAWVNRHALGYSVIPANHALATMAYVSYSRVAKLSLYTSAEVAELLGLAVAHEMAHLLLGSRDHANQGLMRASWRLSDLENKAWNEFQFTRKQTSWLHIAAQARLREQETESTLSTNTYAVLGATPQQEALVRSQIQTMQPAVLPLRVVFVPHWKYVDNTVFYLHVPTGYTSALFTHLPSRTVFVDAERYINDKSLGYWMAHELGHLATNSAKEDDADRAAKEFRKRLKNSLKKDSPLK